MEYDVFDIIGNLGVGLILLAYALITYNKVKNDTYTYLGMNGVGATFVLISLLVEFNLSAFVLELAWVLISLVGIVKLAMQRRSE